MSDPVWIHWNAGLWLLTSDGLELLEKVPRVVLRDVRFVIDPVGLELSRAQGKRKTHAWAIGEPIAWRSSDVNSDGLVWYPLIYWPRHGHDHFAIRDEIGTGEGIDVVDGTFHAWLKGADFLEADGETAQVAGPRYGPTEHRRVQQYGGTR